MPTGHINLQNLEEYHMSLEDALESLMPVRDRDGVLRFSKSGACFQIGLSASLLCLVVYLAFVIPSVGTAALVLLGSVAALSTLRDTRRAVIDLRDHVRSRSAEAQA